jgi:hypothetical protein
MSYGVLYLGRLRCPYCLMLPAISLLTKISNHLELIRPDSKLEQQDKRQVGVGVGAWIVSRMLTLFSSYPAASVCNTAAQETKVRVTRYLVPPVVVAGHDAPIVTWCFWACDSRICVCAV